MINDDNSLPLCHPSLHTRTMNYLYPMTDDRCDEATSLRHPRPMMYVIISIRSFLSFVRHFNFRFVPIRIRHILNSYVWFSRKSLDEKARLSKAVFPEHLAKQAIIDIVVLLLSLSSLCLLDLFQRGARRGRRHQKKRTETLTTR